MSRNSYLEAAVTVLEAVGKPLTSREITQEALRRGLIQPAGKTPEATMSARLYVHVRDTPSPRVVRLAEPGAMRARRGSVRWSLRDWSGYDRCESDPRRRSSNSLTLSRVGVRVMRHSPEGCPSYRHRGRLSERPNVDPIGDNV